MFFKCQFTWQEEKVRPQWNMEADKMLQQPYILGKKTLMETDSFFFGGNCIVLYYTLKGQKKIFAMKIFYIANFFGLSLAKKKKCISGSPKEKVMKFLYKFLWIILSFLEHQSASVLTLIPINMSFVGLALHFTQMPKISQLSTWRWKLSRRSALSSTVALVLRSGGKEPGRLSSSWIRCAIRAWSLKQMISTPCYHAGNYSLSFYSPEN